MPRKASSIAEYYHEATKYRPETINSHTGMDWDSKPPQFKEYPGAESVDLARHLPFKPGRQVALPRFPLIPESETPSLEALARILFCTNGVTGVAQGPGEYHYYRAAPSAGALYPTEIYLAVRTHPEIPDGLYNLHVREHRLQRITPQGFGPEGNELFEALSRASFGHKAVAAATVCAIFSTVFFRSAWRYGRRAYRRCMLDTGHVIGNFCAYTPLEGYVPRAVGGFVDAEVNALLDLDPEREGVCALYPLLGPGTRATLGERGPAVFRSSLFENSSEKDEAAGIVELVAASNIARGDEALITSSTGAREESSSRGSAFRFEPGITFDGSPPHLRATLLPTLLHRRSTRAFSGEGFTLEQLGAMLEYAYRYDLAPSAAESVPNAEFEAGFFDSSLLETWVVVQRVSGLRPGVYYYSPRSRELRLVDEGHFERHTFYLALQQELALNAAAVVIHTSDLPAAVNVWGSRAYRYLHLDAGHLGERLNIAAIEMGLGASGIGGFFDEEVNALLTIPDREACVYITCLGVPETP